MLQIGKELMWMRICWIHSCWTPAVLVMAMPLPNTHSCGSASERRTSPWRSAPSPIRWDMTVAHTCVQYSSICNGCFQSWLFNCLVSRVPGAEASRWFKEPSWQCPAGPRLSCGHNEWWPQFMGSYGTLLWPLWSIHGTGWSVCRPGYLKAAGFELHQVACHWPRLWWFDFIICTLEEIMLLEASVIQKDYSDVDRNETSVLEKYATCSQVNSFSSFQI